MIHGFHFEPIMLIAIRISVDKAKKYVDFFIILFQTHFFETLPPQMSGGEKGWTVTSWDVSQWTAAGRSSAVN